ncbi:MAG: hypothetical protein L3J74_02835 [Bacteroidales bacterium]|nr:hypothetical protein [Bacteroidales bacterium]
MEIKLKEGIDNILFGCSMKYVEKNLGKPDKVYEDEEENKKYQYNKQKLTLTFYKEAGFRLAYIQTSNEEIEILGKKIIGKEIDTVLDFFENKAIEDFKYEDYDSFETYTNEDNWLVLNIEYGLLDEVEIGVIINDDDEYEWKTN